MICWNCDGTGWIIKYSPNRGDPDGDPHLTETKCPTCEGDGIADCPDEE